jgi:hypothetical protein
MAGQLDTIMSPQSVRATYQAMRVPAAFGVLNGATHVTGAGNGGGFRFAVTAWARWHLMDDENGRAQFVGTRCGLCSSLSWRYETNASFPTR